MTFDKAASLRITLQEHEIRNLMAQYPKLSRTEITDVVSREGPMRCTVESELERISRTKR